jgi:hypothetical protein
MIALISLVLNLLAALVKKADTKHKMPRSGGS